MYEMVQAILSFSFVYMRRKFSSHGPQSDHEPYLVGGFFCLFVLCVCLSL